MQVLKRQNSDKKVSIMIVDDSLTNIQILGSRLRSDWVELIVATNGKAALLTLHSVKPDLILLDIMMPEMDGFEVCQRIKADANLKDIPIIFLTARINSEDIVKAFELGAIDYVLKPFNNAELIARVNAHLQLKFYSEEIAEKNQSLEKLNTQLIALDKDKNEFLGIAAHDLKNPIFGISMIAKAMKGMTNYSPEELIECSNEIIASSEKMLELIKNLLDINAIERGVLNMTMQEVDLKEILENLVHIYQGRAKAKRITIDFECTSQSNIIQSDSQIISQILENLISNAVKYSAFDKNVWIKLSVDSSLAIIEVQDDGPGLSEKDQTKLFGKFARLTPQPTGGEFSTGLGLSIVKRLTEALAGSVKCESSLGVGSKFIVELPVK